VTVGMARASANAAELCGDMAQSWALKDRTVLAIADGLGHGKYAAEAAVKAMDYIGKHLDGAPDRLFSGLQRDLRLTRGAAVAVAGSARSNSTYSPCAPATYWCFGQTVWRSG